MRNIEVDIRSFLVPGTYVWIYFIDKGWVPTIVSDNNPTVLATKSIFDDQHVNVVNWLIGFRQGYIQICPN